MFAPLSYRKQMEFHQFGFLWTRHREHLWNSQFSIPRNQKTQENQLNSNCSELHGSENTRKEIAILQFRKMSSEKKKKTNGMVPCSNRIDEKTCENTWISNSFKSHESKLRDNSLNSVIFDFYGSRKQENRMKLLHVRFLCVTRNKLNFFIFTGTLTHEARVERTTDNIMMTHKDHE